MKDVMDEIKLLNYLISKEYLQDEKIYQSFDGYNRCINIRNFNKEAFGLRNKENHYWIR